MRKVSLVVAVVVWASLPLARAETVFHFQMPRKAAPQDHQIANALTRDLPFAVAVSAIRAGSVPEVPMVSAAWQLFTIAASFDQSGDYEVRAEMKRVAGTRAAMVAERYGDWVVLYSQAGENWRAFYADQGEFARMYRLENTALSAPYVLFAHMKDAFTASGILYEKMAGGVANLLFPDVLACRDERFATLCKKFSIEPVTKAERQQSINTMLDRIAGGKTTIAGDRIAPFFGAFKAQINAIARRNTESVVGYARFIDGRFVEVMATP
jgi:hypothetical protein